MKVGLNWARLRDDIGCACAVSSMNWAGLTLVFLIYGFWAGRQSPIFEVWAAPAATKTIPEGGGLRPPPSGMVFGAARAAQTPSVKNPSVGKIKGESGPCFFGRFSALQG